ncbi:hypothetical protein A9Q84_13405 [Halobacteriovorax marinus]|uniref:Methyltransferase domain-containing protein n=1 Tax=Halobacteriovorax marinus TaxID=97084 RepID=A0A1Y5F8Q7_9BACT|nr:hypothetical protein A9Q84_13405 [Halobacteriovorax marinus]
MSRKHLFEIEDQEWFPSFLRQYMTDYLHFGWNTFKLGSPLVPLVKKALDQSNASHVIDLCSGGGGPILYLYNELKNDNLSFTLTDYYPNLEAFKKVERESNGKIKGISEQVDARKVGKDVKGLRTLFSSFHHFNPEDAKKILSEAAENQESILIAEYTERSLPCILKITLSTLFMIFFFTPFVKPFSIGRIIFTYLIPIIPLCLFWDGVVSCLRSYSEDELHGLVSDIKPLGYSWEISSEKVGGNQISYLMGIQLPDSKATI